MFRQCPYLIFVLSSTVFVPPSPSDTVDLVVKVGHLLTVTVSVSDPDNDTVTLKMLSDDNAMTGAVRLDGDDAEKEGGQYSRSLNWTAAGSTFSTGLR